MASESKNLTIMIVDIKGYTERTGASSRDQNIKLVEDLNDLVVPLAEARKGKVIKGLGDALLLSFESPTDGIIAAINIMKKNWENNLKKKQEDLFEIRACLSAGDVVFTANDVFGEAVNLTARLEGITPVNEVYFTEAIYYTMNRNEIPHELVGPFSFKGFKNKVNIYKALLKKPEAKKEERKAPDNSGPLAASRPDQQLKKPNIKQLPTIPKTSLDVLFILDQCIMGLSSEMAKANVQPKVISSKGQVMTLGSQAHLFHAILSLNRFALFHSKGKFEIETSSSMIRTADIQENDKLINYFKKNQPELLNRKAVYERGQKAYKQVFSWNSQNIPKSIEGVVRLWNAAYQADSCRLDLTFSEFFGILYYSGATIKLDDDNGAGGLASLAIKFIKAAA